MLTDNRVLVECHRPLPAIMCVQRRAAKKVVTEDDAIAANIASFGDEIGKTTNWITSMFEVQSNYEEGSKEYEALAYRIRCGQLYQQNCIDRSKGIVSKPMPRYWHDRHSVNQIEDPDEKRFQLSIVADKKPYFMRLVYPALAKQYNTYIRTTNKNAIREFGITVDEMECIPESDRTDRQNDFLRYYYNRMPVGTGDCVMNRICRRFEEVFDGYLHKHAPSEPFDKAILKSDAGYSNAEFKAISKLYESYCKRVKEYVVFASYERVDEVEYAAMFSDLKNEFVQSCNTICPNGESLCNIILDVCYSKNSTKRFAWDMCGSEIIENLLNKNNRTLQYPTMDAGGEISFCGRRFKLNEVRLEERNGDCVE